MDKNITDYLRLNDKEIFKVISKNLPVNVTEPQNIIECKDDILFVWNAKDCSVLSLNIQAATGENNENVQYQTLLCTSPPCHSVRTVRSSLAGAWLGLWGPHGASLLELPRRWGPTGGFQGSREVVTCRTLPVDERYFSSGPLSALVQARWHPASPTDSHLLILTAENSLRLYDADSSGVSLLQIWQIGPRPSALPPTSSKLSFLTGLGDTAVDFDFLPPVLRSDRKSNASSTAAESVRSSSLLSDSHSFSVISSAGDVSLRPTSTETFTTRLSERSAVDWPVAVLNGSGDVFVVTGRFDSQKVEVSSPVAMFPAAADNYGLDSCAMLVLPCTPPLLVLAGSRGVLHHCLLMSTDPEDEDPFGKVEHTLYVLESVELQLGLDLSASVPEGPQDNCPLHLIRDDIDPARYLVYHSAGVHGVTVSAVEQLQEFLESEDANVNLNVPTLNTPCSAEYLLCTNFTRNNNTNNNNSAVLGLTIFGAPPTLIVLQANGQVISLPLTSVPFSYMPPKSILASSGLEVKSPLKKMLKEPFDAHIRRILKPKLTQPILKLGEDLSPTQSFDVVTRALKILREQYFTKHDEARQEIEKRVHALRLLKKQQLLEIKRLTDTKTEIQNRAEKLAERCEDVHEKQEALSKRAEMVLRLASQKLPRVTQVEREFFDKLRKAEKRCNEFVLQLNRAKKNMDRQNVMMQQYENQNKKKDVYLSEKQIDAIKVNLQERTTQIAQLVKDVNLINNHFDLA